MSSPLLDETPLFNQVEQVLQADLFDRGDMPADITPLPFTCEGFRLSLKHKVKCFYDEKTRQSRVQNFCMDLFAAVNDSACHFPRLDELFSKLLDCNFIPSESVFKVTECACQILTRLPATPLALDSGTIQLDPVYYSSTYPLETLSPETPGTTYKSLELSAQIQFGSHYSSPFIEGVIRVPWTKFLNTVAELLEVVSQLAAIAEPGSEEQNWFIVRAFLWTA